MSHIRPAVVVEDAADPDAPNRTIRRARRSDPLRLMGMSDREWAAAERLRADFDLSQGYREGDGMPVRVDTSPRGSVEFTDMQLDAQTSLTGALMRAWPYHDVLFGVVLEWKPLDVVARERRMRRERVPEWLRLGLARLTEFYG